MKKVFMSIAIVALMAAAVACGNNNAKKAEAPVEEAVEACCDSTCCTKADSTCCEHADSACCEKAVVAE